MQEAELLYSRHTSGGLMFDTYRMPNGGALLVPMIPDWELRQLQLERWKQLTPAERSGDGYPPPV